MKATIRKLISILLWTSFISAAQENNKGATTSPSANGITQEQSSAILDELRAIHQLLASQQIRPMSPAPPVKQAAAKVEMSLGHSRYSLGRDDAPVTVVEFADYQCPFCRKYHTDTFPELKKNYIDTGKVRFISRDLPLEFHDGALRAAESVRCAGEQGKYWELRNLLIANSKKLTKDNIRSQAESLSLDLPAFERCVDSGSYKTEIEKDIADANALQIGGTPTFVVGRASSDLLKGVLLIGAQSYSTFDSVIQEAMKAAP